MSKNTSKGNFKKREMERANNSVKNANYVTYSERRKHTATVVCLSGSGAIGSGGHVILYCF